MVILQAQKAQQMSFCAKLQEPEYFMWFPAALWVTHQDHTSSQQVKAG